MHLCPDTGKRWIHYTLFICVLLRNLVSRILRFMSSQFKTFVLIKIDNFFPWQVIVRMLHVCKEIIG